LFDSLSVILGPEALGGAGSHEALLEALLGEGIPLHRTTETGGLSTDKFALQEFAAEFPVVAEYQEFRTTEKFLSTYIEPMVGTTEVHPSFRQIGAWTGRMSCMRPNMQNIPVRAGNEVRECFVARPGFKLVVADYDSIEMRILAHYLGAAGTPYRDLINGGFDPHAYMASQLYGGKPEDYFKGTPGEKQRAVAKNSLFAIVYGAGGKRLCDMNDLPTGPPMKADAWEIRNGIPGYYEGGPSYAQGKALARQIKSNVPGYGALMKRVRAKVEGTGFITTLLGRKQALARDKGYIGMSALVQGSAADVMKMGLAAADPIIDNHGGHILLVVHDEIVAEVPEGQAEAALAGLRHALETAVELDPPLLTSGVICDNYGQAK
jgi:DNA polymerase-1